MARPEPPTSPRTRPPNPRDRRPGPRRPDRLGRSLRRATAAIRPTPPISPLHGDLSEPAAAGPPLGGQTTSSRRTPRRSWRSAQATGTDLEHQRLDGLWHDIPPVRRHRRRPPTEAIAELGRSIRSGSSRVAVAARHGSRSSAPGCRASAWRQALKHAGFDDFTIHEKAEEVGGTWRENRYPGLSCDVPSRFYSYSFAPNPDWSSVVLARARDPGLLRSHGRRTRPAPADPLRLRGHATRAGRTAAGCCAPPTATRDVADVVVTATGVLHHPKFPDIPGLETFAGARSTPRAGTRRSTSRASASRVIGTGSTGRADRRRRWPAWPGSLSSSSARAQWIAAGAQPPRTRRSLRTAMRRVAGLNRLSYRFYQRALEAILGRPLPRRTGSAARSSPRSAASTCASGSGTPSCARRLTPDYQPMCKRLVMSAGFYPAIQQPGVELVTERASTASSPRGIVTADGRCTSST